MIRRNGGRGVALPKDALDVPEGLLHARIEDWTDYGMWGLLLYEEQPPWFTLVECMHILFYRQRAGQENLFEPVTNDMHGHPRHENVRYQVPLNLGLRYLLFRDLETDRIATQGSPHAKAQWDSFFRKTKSGASELGVSFAHLPKIFDDVKSLNDSLELLRRTEIGVFSRKRWTSRHILPLGPDLLFADVREGSWGADRRFVRRSGELLYLMLGRSRVDLRNAVQRLLRERLLTQQSPWNELAKLIRGGSSTSEPADQRNVGLGTGYLPIPKLPVYDRLAEDWKALLSLSGKPIEDLLDPLMRLSALHQIIYILDRAHTTKTGDPPDSFPPFVFELAGSARKNPVQRISVRQYSSHLRLPRQAIDSFIDAFAQSSHWQGVLGTSTEHVHAANILKEMFKWKKDDNDSVRGNDTPNAILENFRLSAVKGSKRSIWATFAAQTKGVGMVLAKRRAGTWYAPNDAFVEALVLGNVRGPTELGVFLNTLYKRYRIVIGQEQGQRAFGSDRAISLEQLKINEQRLEQRLRVLGFVDRKSDGCAFVVNPYYQDGDESRAEAA